VSIRGESDPGPTRTQLDKDIEGKAMDRLRKTGFVNPDRVPWGTHLCQFYETKDDLLEVLVSYFKEGLAANESCIWVTSDPFSVEEAKNALRVAVPELDHYLMTGQMEIMPHDTWYLTGGSFDIDAVLAGWCKKAEIAVSRGYCGLRATGNAACLHDEHWAEWVAYEENVQAELRHHKVIALCSFPLNRCTASQFLQAVNSHDCAIVRQQGGWECIESNGGKQLLNRLVHELEVHQIELEMQNEELRRTQGEIEASNERYFDLYDLAPVGYFTVSHNGMIREANLTAAVLLGVARSDLLNRQLSDFIVFEDQDILYKHHRQLFATVSPQVSQLRMVRKDAAPFWARMEATAPHDDEDGTPVYRVVVSDITEHKRGEQVLHESEERYRTLVENIDLGITLIDRQHRIVMVNEGQARMFKTTPRECVGQECFRLFEKREAMCLHCPGVTALNTGCPAEFETQGVRDDGSTFAVKIRAFPIYESGGTPSGFIEVTEDITERKRTEEDIFRAKQVAEAANRAKSEFLANMSHEIRTPMTAILGFTDILLGNSSTEEESATAAEIIKRNGMYLLDLINGILDLSKIEAGKCTVDLQPCSPSQIAADVVSMMKVPADAKGLPLSLEVQGRIPEEVTTDPIRVRQSLVNLIGNAIKFTEVGSVRVVLRLDSAPKSESKLVFDVIDTGIGMSPEQMGLLFQPFSQVDGSARRRFGGTGLGLAISKRMAEMLGGDIVVRSSPGQGSTFSFSIGIGRPDGLAMTQELSPAVTARGSVRGASQPLDCRILLAEDGPDNQRLIAFLLRKAGAEVELADNGQIALDLALAALQAGSPFDLILMDMQMPVMDGYEATRNLRSARYRQPIIALTAHAMTEDRQKCLDAGCDDYMAKPVKRESLLTLVAKYAAVSSGSERPLCR
jgi:PAS domain S-box-containing protein